VVERAPKLLPREDDDVAAEIRAVLEREGIRIRTDAECMELKQAGKRIVVGLIASAASRSRKAHTRCSPSAVREHRRSRRARGRHRDDERGYIKVDDECRTSVNGVWALGECNGRGAFTHTAYNDYEIVAANLFDNDKRRISDRIMTYALFIDPPLGRAGMTRQRREEGKRVLVGNMPMARVARAREAGETQGFMRVWWTPSQRSCSAPRSRHERRRGGPLAARHDVRQAALHDHPARHAHPPDGHRADPDVAGKPEAALVLEQELNQPGGAVQRLPPRASRRE